jgi:hypothetical protein
MLLVNRSRLGQFCPREPLVGNRWVGQSQPAIYVGNIIGLVMNLLMVMNVGWTQ